MNNGASRESAILLQITAALLECGIPAKATFDKMVVDVGSRHRYCVDMLVAANDGKTPQLVFEVKDRMPRTRAYEQARRQMAGMLDTFACFVATRETDKDVYLTRVLDKQVQDDAWVALSDIAGVKALIGDYHAESQAVISRSERPACQFTEKQFTGFRVFLAIGTTLAFIPMFVYECVTGRAVSYPLAGVVAVSLVLFASSYGLVREVKFKDVGAFSFYPQKDEDQKS